MYSELLPFSKFAKISFWSKCGVTSYYQMTAMLTSLHMSYGVIASTNWCCILMEELTRDSDYNIAPRASSA